MMPLRSSILLARAAGAVRAVGREVASEFASRLTLRLAVEAGDRLREHLARVETLQQLEELQALLSPEAWALVIDLYDVLRKYAGMNPISAARSTTH
jgi:hypothetical protein